jgi:Zn finger protein HypA/HybF involved in hydrogenase expression
MGKNKVRRYRLNNVQVQKLGLEPNKNNRYRLSKEKEIELLKLRESQFKIKRLFFDIETSPMIVYSWRTGWKLNIGTENIIKDWRIICISYKWEHEDKVHNLTWDKNQCDKQMLIDFISIMNKADECIAHNGDRFDIKKIRTRCIFHRIPMFPTYKTLDTLKKAKSGFNFNSNRLDYIAKFLGVGAKLEHEGFNMWVKCMQGDKEALKNMVEYCDMDIIVLEDVFLTLQNYILPNTHAGVINNNLKYSCPRCSSENVELLKNTVTAMGTIKRKMECSDCGGVHDISNASYMNFLKFKNVI